MKGFAIYGTQALREAFVKETGLSLYSDSTLSRHDTLVPYDNDGEKKLQGGGGVSDGRVRFNLPEDYSKALDYVKEYYEEKEEKEEEGGAVNVNSLKPGEWVVVLEEDEHYYNSEKIPQRVVNINCSTGWVTLRFQNGEENSYQKVRRTTSEEIEKMFLSQICGYDKKVVKGKTLGYGCKTFSKEEVKAILTAMKCFKVLDGYLKSVTGDTLDFGDVKVSYTQLNRLYEEIG